MRKKLTTLSCEDGSLVEMEVHVDPDGVACHPVKAEYTLQPSSNSTDAASSNIHLEVLDVFKDRVKQLEKDLDASRDRATFLEKQNESLQLQLRDIFDTLIQKVSRKSG